MPTMLAGETDETQQEKDGDTSYGAQCCMRAKYLAGTIRLFTGHNLVL